MDTCISKKNKTREAKVVKQNCTYFLSVCISVLISSLVLLLLPDSSGTELAIDTCDLTDRG